SAGVAVVIYLFMPQINGTGRDYLMADFLSNVAIVGPVEEFSKFIVFFLVVRKLDSIREPTDGLLQGATVGLAFTSVENVMYTWWYDPSLIPFRSVFNVVGHMSYGALWGVIYVIITMSKTSPDQQVPFRHFLLALVPAGIAHGLYNFLLNYGIGIGLLYKAVVLTALLIIYRYSVRLSPYRNFDPKQHASAIRSIQLALNANPTDPKLNYRLMLYAVYAGRLELAAESAQWCLKQNPRNPILLGWYGIIDILSGDCSMGRDGLEVALRLATDRQRAILLGSVQKVVRSESLRNSLSETLSKGSTVKPVRGNQIARGTPF
ncbi:MAG: PrsW family intramembrane metalloprotease, partial [Spirochaetales bacterium]|nr:PrsW family intramembrane metalloprotease [Spirochaetales bacterium]